jgi:hypothetical protein
MSYGNHIPKWHKGIIISYFPHIKKNKIHTHPIKHDSPNKQKQTKKHTKNKIKTPNPKTKCEKFAHTKTPYEVQ